MAAVDQDGELDSSGAPDASQRVERRFDRASRVQNIVDQHDGPTIDAGDWNQRFLGGAQRLAGQVVAEHRRVDDGEVGVGAGDLADPVDEPTRKRCSARGDAGDDEILATAVAFNDFVGNTCQGSGNVTRSKYFFAARCAISVQ